MFIDSFLCLMRSNAAKACALALIPLSWLGATPCAAVDWSTIQGALHADGTQMPGSVLRLELVRQDLALTLDGQTVPITNQAAVANGFIAFQPIRNARFFADGSLPAQESELSTLLAALRANTAIHITAVGSRVLGLSPSLIWVHFEAVGNGSALATTLATALETIHNPQVGVVVIPGTNTVFDPSSILPPQFLTLFNHGFVEQLMYSFAFYLPRPDENRFTVDGVSAEPGLGVGQSFNIEVPFSGGTNITINIDLALRADEVQAVEDTLRTGGFSIASESNHYVDESPRLFYVHATASGDGFSLGNTLYRAIRIIGNH